MQIIKNSMVRFHYRMVDANDNSPLESSYDSEAKEYIHGVSDMLVELTHALEGKSMGDTFEITLSPEQAYGHYDPNKIGRISLNYVYLPGGRSFKGKLKPGTAVEIRTEHGMLEGSVIKQGLKTMDIDANHPYAGKLLRFSIEVVDVRAATADELSSETGCNSCSCC